MHTFNCLTLRVARLTGRGELKTLQKHDQHMLDCLHVAWFWGRLRQDGEHPLHGDMRVSWGGGGGGGGGVGVWWKG